MKSKILIFLVLMAIISISSCSVDNELDPVMLDELAAQEMKSDIVGSETDENSRKLVCNRMTVSSTPYYGTINDFLLIEQHLQQGITLFDNTCTILYNSTDYFMYNSLINYKLKAECVGNDCNTLKIWLEPIHLYCTDCFIPNTLCTEMTNHSSLQVGTYNMRWLGSVQMDHGIVSIQITLDGIMDVALLC